MSMMALDLRNDWRTVEQAKAQPKPLRSLLITLTTAFAVAGILLLRHPSTEAADPAPTPAPAPLVVVAPAPVAPPPVIAAPEPAPASPATAASTAPAHKKKKHAVSHEDPTRRALRDLQRAQLDRATSSQ